MGIVLLCLLGGFFSHVIVANPVGSYSYALERLASPAVYVTFGSVLFSHFCYFTLRSLLLDRPRHLGGEDIALSVMLAALLYVACLVVVALLIIFLGRAPENVLLVLATILPAAILFMQTYRLERSDEQFAKDQAHRFVPKIFFPAFSICFLAFCLGWLLYRSSKLDQGTFYGLSLAMLIIFLSTYRTATLIAGGVVVFVVALLALSLLATWAERDFGAGLLIALLWTFAIGFAEVAKRPYLLAENRAIFAPNEPIDFYIAGANWSSIIFLNLLIFLPLLVPTLTLLYVIGFVALGAIWSWHSILDKRSVAAHRRALLIGYSLPIIIIALLFGDGIFSWIFVRIAEWYGVLLASVGGTTIALQTDRLVTLLGVFLTIIFVLFPDEYRRLPREIVSLDAFLSSRGCLLFAAFAIAVQAVLLTFLFGLTIAINRTVSNDFQYRIDVILMILILELLLILLFLFFSNADGGRESDRRPSPPTEKDKDLVASSSPTQPFRLLIRPATSLLAGALAVAFALRAHETSLLSATASFACATALSMFGFVVNDIFDREKDALAARLDKPIALGQVSVRNAVAIAAGLGLLALFTASLIGRFSIPIVSIGLALLLIYSQFSARFPKLKGFYTGVLCCLPIFIGVGGDLSDLSIGLLLILILFIFGREIVIDVSDMAHDRKAGHATIPVTFGGIPALIVGWSSMLLALGALVLIQAGGFGALLAFIAVLSLLGISVLHGLRDIDKAVSLSRFTMLLAVGSVAVGP